MAIFGAVLLILGLIFGIELLWIIGIVLLVFGLLMLAVGRRVY